MSKQSRITFSRVTPSIALNPASGSHSSYWKTLFMLDACRKLYHIMFGESIMGVPSRCLSLLVKWIFNLINWILPVFKGTILILHLINLFQRKRERQTEGEREIERGILTSFLKYGKCLCRYIYKRQRVSRISVGKLTGLRKKCKCVLNWGRTGQIASWKTPHEL